MSQVINTNVLSLNAQRNLSTSGGQLAQSLQRLSSGLRINSAKDDAAGLAISERFTTQIRGMNQAIRNANDGVSLAQVAEGSMSEITNNLQRIRELAVQARNATNSETDRAALQAEVVQRRDEIQRIAEQTQFNGTNLLDGSFSAQAFQVGANQGQTIAISNIADAQTTALGEWETVAEGFSAEFTFAAADTVVDDDRWGYAAQTLTIDVDGVETAVSIAASTAPVSGGDGFETELEAREALASAVATAINGTSGFAGEATVDGTTVTLALAEDFTGAGIAGAVFNAATENESEDQVGFADISVGTANGADNAIRAMDAALTAINSARGDMGAVQNRFESVVANLSTTVENLSASRSRIMDTDFAAETAALTRAQVLQQAGVAMLSQANAAPQNVLALLR